MIPATCGFRTQWLEDEKICVILEDGSLGTRRHLVLRATKVPAPDVGDYGLAEAAVVTG